MSSEPQSNSRTDTGARGVAQRAVDRFRRRATRQLRLGQALKEVEGLPAVVQPAARWAVSRSATEDESRLMGSIEAMRSEIASRGDAGIVSFSSPVPGSFELDAQGHAVPGPATTSPPSRHALTGSGSTKGILLRRLAEGVAARRILELGTNTGMSGSYLATAPSCDILVTIEGSPELADIARDTLGRFTDRAEVRCAMFDEALDDLSSEAPFELAFLDGQHDGAAVRHYVGRLVQLLSTAGMVVLDDIYWSSSMNDTWRTLVADAGFEVTVDLGDLGVIIPGVGTRRAHHDFARFVGRPRIPPRVGD